MYKTRVIFDTDILYAQSSHWIYQEWVSLSVIISDYRFTTLDGDTFWCTAREPSRRLILVQRKDDPTLGLVWDLINICMLHIYIYVCYDYNSWNYSRLIFLSSLLLSKVM
jgi:hypothetical protein